VGGVLRVTFRILDTSEVGRAHAWHSGFASANDAILPRTEQQFYDLALDRSLWCAITDEDEILGMSYLSVSGDNKKIEVGGLMVAKKTRGQGIGDAMLRLPLIHFLVNERPLRWEPQPCILTHVVAGNDDPVRIIERCGFKFAFSDSWPAEELPGLRTGDDGKVHGHEFHLVIPDGVQELAKWMQSWNGKLRDGTDAEIKMLEDESIEDWAGILSSMT
jgi:GNAT superfamily N-acetyltransferase